MMKDYAAVEGTNVVDREQARALFIEGTDGINRVSGGWFPPDRKVFSVAEGGQIRGMYHV